MEEEMEVDRSSFWNFKGAVPYVDEWFLMGSPIPVLVFLFSYLYFVLRCGPKFMQNRPAFKLRKLLLLYNAFQVAFSLYMVCIGIEIIYEVGLMEHKYCVMDDEDKKFRIVRGFYIYMLAKLSELLDTVFFVLRKKWNQISFLHVYHHSLMFSCTWICLKYEPTYSVIFLGTLNSFVHVIMYAYYGLSAFPRLQKYLWWKRYITKMQLIQFLVVVLQITWNYMVTPCQPSYILMCMCWIHFFLFTYLFTDFYVKSYLKKKKEDMDKADLKAKKKLNVNDGSSTNIKDCAKLR